MRKFAYMAVIVVLASPVWALSKPPELTRIIRSDTPYGAATLSKLFWDVYDIRLWTDAASWNYDSAFALSITYRMALDGKDLVERTFDEMEKSGADVTALRAAHQAALMRAFPDVAEGDRITAVYAPDGNVRFFYNGVLTETIRSEAFARAFFDIWLASTTSEPQLRGQLLAP